MYLIFTIINIAVAVPIYRDWQAARHKGTQPGERGINFYLAISMLTVSSLLWALVMLWTISCWIESMMPGPKPHFLIIWLTGMILLGAVSLVRNLPSLQIREKGDPFHY